MAHITTAVRPHEVPAFKSLLYPHAGLRACWHPFPSPEIPPNVLDALPEDTSGYPISRALGRFLAQRVLERRIHNVLELGAGSSSVVFAEALSHTGGKLTSIEGSPEWCAEQWRKVESTGIDAWLAHGSLGFGVAPFPCYRLSARNRGIIQSRAPYDLVLVDAPQYYYGRDGALPLIADVLAPGALIVVDDAGRHEEQWAIRRWLWTYPGLSLVAYDPAFGRNGIAVFCWGGDNSRISLRAWLTGAFHSMTSCVLRMLRVYDAAPSSKKLSRAPIAPQNPPA